MTRIARRQTDGAWLAFPEIILANSFQVNYDFLQDDTDFVQRRICAGMTCALAVVACFNATRRRDFGGNDSEVEKGQVGC
jgi:hypothetical protein